MQMVDGALAEDACLRGGATCLAADRPLARLGGQRAAELQLRRIEVQSACVRGRSDRGIGPTARSEPLDVLARLDDRRESGSLLRRGVGRPGK
jgi:hypothetical protein